MSTGPENPTSLTDVALAAAARGWPVFPLAPAGKRPALHGADRCPGTGPCAGGHAGWEQRATTDPDRIARAWTAGSFNVGIACGPAGLVVIDLDRPDPGHPADIAPELWAARGVIDGAGALAWVAAEAGEQVPATRTVITPSGGRHLYFRTPAGPAAPALRNTQGDRGRGLGWKVDTRAHGGYVVAPGSRTPAGTYRLVDDRDPAALPGWLARRLAPPPLPPAPTGSIRTAAGRVGRYLHAAITAETARVHDAPAGQRNACLYVAAVALGQLVAGGALPEPDARAVLLSAAGRHLALGAYSPRQAEQTIASGLRAGAKRPRTITDPAGAAA
ncbi:bifunctional DNA primase/polymerase [Pseudonocardia acidicola]|uniref:Bifunctional DNA primase/polymerase n=1 Tax=Pseudonocardia acidicola TaxID=2724939 RepID=A0ABX1SHJ9_9PSEU|nr:bifunctional DNA primase/polymerase [Pseudonocardia acidicola]NMI01050.1 bifunctional DNA primase/polymerase [Pseudonocardia acidicola]